MGLAPAALIVVFVSLRRGVQSKCLYYALVRDSGGDGSGDNIDREAHREVDS